MTPPPPQNHAQIACIDARDIGEVGAVALFEGKEKHGGKTYTLTGPKAYTMGEVAEIFTRVLGREIRYKVSLVEGLGANVFWWAQSPQLSLLPSSKGVKRF